MMGCAVLMLALLVDAALPPGYEDEVYCPAGYCLRPKPKTRMAGGKSIYVECFADDGRDEPVKEITTWGPKKPQADKDKLVAGGYHEKKCEPYVQGTPTYKEL
jgi:hypothetical protein